MKTNEHRTTNPFLRDRAIRIAAVLAVAAASTVSHAAVILDPTLPGQYAEGTGADATFLSIDGKWQKTKVFWNEDERTFSNAGGQGFERIKSLAWGTGIWGLEDWRTINETESVKPVHIWTGVVPTISHGDTEWSECAKPDENCAKWGAVGSLPTGFFGSEAKQDNWTANYTGFIRISDPGEYNFGVLYDDGFFLNIWGADGSRVQQISSDFLSPRERLGFDENLFMTPGLYRFELGAYDRLEVGVVNLAWLLNGKWSTVPTEHLVTDPIPIPTPGTMSLLLAAAGALAWVRMRRKRG